MGKNPSCTVIDGDFGILIYLAQGFHSLRNKRDKTNVPEDLSEKLRRNWTPRDETGIGPIMSSHLLPAINLNDLSGSAKVSIFIPLFYRSDYRNFLNLDVHECISTSISKAIKITYMPGMQTPGSVSIYFQIPDIDNLGKWRSFNKRILKFHIRILFST